MQNIKRILSIISVSIFICSCATPQSQSETETEFPECIVEKISAQMDVNAKVIFPSSCKNGIGIKTKLGTELFWDRQSEISKLLLSDKEITNEYIDDYGTTKYKTYESATNDTILVISDNNTLSYSTKQASYINNVLSSDSRFDSYNGDKYQTQANLDFMPQDEAWSKVHTLLDALDINISENITCFVMDYETMAEEEKKAIIKAEEEDTKIPTAKKYWTKSDDCYYFMAHTEWNEYPVLPPVMGEGFDENNVTIIYDANGIESLYINGFFPLEAETEFKLQPPESVVKALNKYVENIITDDIYEVQKIMLCQKVMQINPEKHSADIIPAWECSVLIKSQDEMDNRYLQKIYFDAETLKVI